MLNFLMLNLAVRKETAGLSKVKQHAEQIFGSKRFFKKKQNIP